MKFLVIFALVAVAFAAPQTRKAFHEHFEDFFNLIEKEASHDLEHVLEHYLEFEEFQKTLNYIRTANFKNLVQEMEELSEFKAVVDFLEGHSIDIHYFIDSFNEMLDIDLKKKVRHTISGRDLSSFIHDCIDEFPKTQLAALYNQKLAEDEDFKAAIEGLQSEEWNQVYSALWATEQFQAEVKTLSENGIDLDFLLRHLNAIFGQH